MGITSNKIENFEATDVIDDENGLRFVYHGLIRLAQSVQTVLRQRRHVRDPRARLQGARWPPGRRGLSIDSGTLFDYDPVLRTSRVVF